MNGIFMVLANWQLCHLILAVRESDRDRSPGGINIYLAWMRPHLYSTERIGLRMVTFGSSGWNLIRLATIVNRERTSPWLVIGQRVKMLKSDWLRVRWSSSQDLVFLSQTEVINLTSVSSDCRSQFVWIMAAIFLKRAGVLNCPTITCLVFRAPGDGTRLSASRASANDRRQRGAASNEKTGISLGVNSDATM